MSCVNMSSVIVMVVSMVSMVVGQAIKENEDVEFKDMGTVEAFLKTKEFKVSYWETKKKAKTVFLALNFC